MAGGWQMMETTQSGTWKLHQTEHLWRFSYSTPWGPRWGGVRPNNQTLEIKISILECFQCQWLCPIGQQEITHTSHSKAKDWKAKSSVWSDEEFLFLEWGSPVCWFARPIPNLNKCDGVSGVGFKQAELLWLPDKSHPRRVMVSRLNYKELSFCKWRGISLFQGGINMSCSLIKFSEDPSYISIMSSSTSPSY